MWIFSLFNRLVTPPEPIRLTEPRIIRSISLPVPIPTQPTRNEKRTPNGGRKTSNPFEALPAEILSEIFSKLDVESLKSCRLVNTRWNRVISCESLFLSKICAVHRATYNDGIAAKAKVDYFARGSRLIANHLRLRHVFSSRHSGPPSLFAWMTSDTMSNVTHLDLRSSHILLSHLLLMVSEFNQISCLTIEDDTLVWTPYDGLPENHPEFNKSYWARSKRKLKQIKTLRFHIPNLHSILQTFDRYDLLNFVDLADIDFQGSAGLQSTFQVGRILAKILKTNGKTLKKLRFDGFHCQVQGALDKTLANSDSSWRTELYSEFESFLIAIQDDEWNSLKEENLAVEILSLNRFPVANMSDNRVVDNFIPLLRKMTKLREVHFGQAYFPKDSEFVNFVSIFPPMCKINLESVHLVAPTVDLTDIVQVLHSNKNILKYARSSVELQFENRNLFWKIRYLTWTSLKNTVLENYLCMLKKIRFHRIMFSVTDEEFQLIVRGAEKLTELHFEYCDLLNLTDSGLTGLSHAACAWITANRNYEIRQDDYIGAPLSALSNLQSLKLSNVGDHVTDVTAKIAFQGLQKLRNLTIYQEPRLLISSDGIRAITENKRIVLRYEHSHLSED